MAQDTTKYLPQNVEAEAAALGSVLVAAETGRGNAVVAQIRDVMRPDDCYTEAHRVILAHMLALYDAREPVDLITLFDGLERSGKLDAVGGAAYVSSLANQVPHHLNAAKYAETVRDAADRRRLIQAAGDIAAAGYSGMSAGEALDASIKQLLALTSYGVDTEGAQPISVALHEAMDDILTRMEGDTPPGIATGLPELDKAIGPIEDSDFVIIAGRPGSLKSVFGEHLATQHALRCVEESAPARREADGTVTPAVDGGSVLWVTLEMTRAQQARRMLANAARVNSRAIRAGFRRSDGSIDREAYAKVRAGYEALLKALDDRLHIKDGIASMDTLRALAIREKLEHNTRLLVVDQFDLLSADTNSAQYKSKLERLEDYSRRLKLLAIELRIPVILLVQLNRESTKEQEAELTHLAGTDRLGRDANTVLAIRRPAADDRERAKIDTRFREFMLVKVVKARDADPGVHVAFRVEPEYSNIETWPYGGPETWPGEDMTTSRTLEDN